jgi:hypothetical protein
VYHLGNQTSAPVTFAGINRAHCGRVTGLRLAFMAELKGSGISCGSRWTASSAPSP